jgi:hypothetical protein
MKKTALKFAGIGATLALVTSLVFLFFGPKDILGWEPVGILADTVFWPGFKAGVYAANHWGAGLAGGWAVGVLTMTVIGAMLGLAIGGIIGLWKRA